MKFIVTAKGDIIDVHLENKVHQLLDEQALNLVKNMPGWKTGLEDNQEADFAFILPVAFTLQGIKR